MFYQNSKPLCLNVRQIVLHYSSQIPISNRMLAGREWGRINRLRINSKLDKKWSDWNFSTFGHTGWRNKILTMALSESNDRNGLLIHDIDDELYYCIYRTSPNSKEIRIGISFGPPS